MHDERLHGNRGSLVDAAAWRNGLHGRAAARRKGVHGGTVCVAKGAVAQTSAWRIGLHGGRV